jgi:Transcription elongation factor, GreA/GreB, C-term
MPWPLGSTFTIYVGGRERIFLVDDIEPNTDAGRISQSSPLGQALLNTNVGEIAHWENAVGKVLSGEVLRVESAGDFDDEPDAQHGDEIRQTWLFRQAEHFHKLFLEAQDGWNLVRASKYFRQAGRPQRSVEITDVMFDDPRLQTAICATRAGALLDLGQTGKAQALVNQAVASVGWSKQLYMVQARIYSVQGRSDEAAHYGQLGEDRL